jgi:hypothetical protein
MNYSFRLFLAGLFLSISTISFGQTYDSRLEPHYTKEQIQTMIKEDVATYKFLINCLNKAIFIADIPAEKAKDIMFNGEIQIDPNAKHTFLSLGLQITDEYQYYKVEGTNKMLVVLPRIFMETK